MVFMADQIKKGLDPGWPKIEPETNGAVERYVEAHELGYFKKQM
jgi:hypothetical protein